LAKYTRGLVDPFDKLDSEFNNELKKADLFIIYFLKN
jgi:hypothetical protein